MLYRLAIIAGISASMAFAQEETPDHHLRAAAEVFHEIMAAPDRGIPHDLLERARCVVIVPGFKKAAFVVGGEYGRGIAMCRHADAWGGPAALRLSGGSFGVQIGVESTDIILLVMNDRGMEKLAGDKFTVGADASVAAGPVGRTAAADTDARLNAEILSYSRAKGVFAGISLAGTVVTKDDGEDRKIYGHEVSNRAIIRGEVEAPPAAAPLREELARYTPLRKG